MKLSEEKLNLFIQNSIYTAYETQNPIWKKKKKQTNLTRRRELYDPKKQKGKFIVMSWCFCEKPLNVRSRKGPWWSERESCKEWDIEEGDQKGYTWKYSCCYYCEERVIVVGWQLTTFLSIFPYFIFMFLSFSFFVLGRHVGPAGQLVGGIGRQIEMVVQKRQEISGYCLFLHHPSAVIPISTSTYQPRNVWYYNNSQQRGPSITKMPSYFEYNWQSVFFYSIALNTSRYLKGFKYHRSLLDHIRLPRLALLINVKKEVSHMVSILSSRYFCLYIFHLP